MTGECRDGRGQGRYGLRKDDGQNAGHVHLHGEVGALAAVHLTSDNALCVLDGDAALGVVYQNDQNDHCKCAEEQEDVDPPCYGAVYGVGDHLVQGRRKTGNDTCKQDDGNTVADAELCDLLAEPHDKGRARGEGQDDDDRRPDALAVSGQEAGLHDHVVVSKALDQADCYGGVTSDGGDLLLAFLALFLAHTLERRDCDAQELNDDGCVDVGLDGKCEDRCV